MNLTVTPQELLYLYDCLVKDDRNKDVHPLLTRVRSEINRCLEKDHEETTTKQFKVWNQSELKKIENLEKINNDVKLTSDLVKKFSENSNILL